MTCPDHPDIVRAMATGFCVAREAVCLCDACGEAIYEGDSYVDIFGERYCSECIEERTKVAERR